MSQELASAAQNGAAVSASALEQVVIGNDLQKLSPAQRLEFYSGVCTSLGLNPLTRPFQYIVLNGKLTLYATKDCTEQLRKIYNVSITLTDKRFDQDVYVVTAQARMPDGRTDESTGAVTIGNLKGDARANALMKAETKAKRRVTLSICGMGMLDENEVSTIADAKFVQANFETGEISETPKPLADGSTWSATVRKAIQELGLTKTEYHKLGELCDANNLRTDEMVVDAFEEKCISFDDVYDFISSRCENLPAEPTPAATQESLDYNPSDEPVGAHGFNFTPSQLAKCSVLAKDIEVSRDHLLEGAWAAGKTSYPEVLEYAKALIELKKKAVAS